jgi:hypothetical protein
MNLLRIITPSLPGILIVGLAWPSWASPLVDPTKPPDFMAVAPVPLPSEIPQEVIDYRLNAVKIGAKSRWAIINSERVQEGDKVGAAQVLQIQPGRVLMDYNGQQITLSLLAHDVKNPLQAGRPQGVKP